MENTILRITFIAFGLATLLSCRSSKVDKQKSTEVYRTPILIINKISKNTFQHISYLKTNDYGNVACNGLVVMDNKEAIVFDTPTNDASSLELQKWITEHLLCKIIAAVPTHFHDDCLGGLKAFHDKHVTSYASFKTIELAKSNKIEMPKIGFDDAISLVVGDSKVEVVFLGEGHTKDNVVAYYPNDNVLFGGCLIKELKASKGFLGDANTKEWSNTVRRVKNSFPNVKIVVPGHGKIGNAKLLDYTIKLFSAYQFGENVFKEKQ